MDKIAVLIPCYNESMTIQKVVTDFKMALPDAKIYVYDNNSSDNTALLASQAGAIVRHEPQQGKGNVVRRMFQEIDAHCYILTDGDDTYPAQAGLQMADMVLSQHIDMVIGDRLSSTYFQENKRLFHNAGNIFVRSTINRLFHSNIKDIMTGYRAFSYRFVKTFPVLSQKFEIETEMSIHAIDKHLQIENLAIDYKDRPTGSESKLNTYFDGFRILKTILNLYHVYRPLAFFGAISCFLSIIGCILMVPVLKTYFLTGLVPRFPTLIVSGYLLIAALQLFCVGLTLQTILKKIVRILNLNYIGLWNRRNALLCNLYNSI